MGKTVGQMMSEMDANEFVEWIALDELSPIGRERADLRAAQLTAVVANCHRAKTQTPFKTEDFLLRDEPPKNKSVQLWDRVKTVFKGLGYGDSRTGSS